MESEKTVLQRPPHPRAKAGIFSIATFSWTLDLFFKGRKRDLVVGDLYETLKDHSSSALGSTLEKYWNNELDNAVKGKRDPSLLRALVRMFGARMMMYGMVLAVVEIFLRLSIPRIIKGFLAYFEKDSVATKDQSYIYGGILIIVLATSLVIFHPYQISMFQLGMNIRVSCCALIYRKALKLSKTALGETTVGQVVNLLSNDVNRFDIAVIFLHYLWLGPLETIIVTYFLWQEIDWASCIGVAALLLFIPLQGYLGKKTSALRLKTAIRTDERVRLMNEIISGIQVIKMYTWEKPFAALVAKARKKEVNEIKGTSHIRGVLLSFIIFHTRIALFFSIFSYVVVGNTITAQKVFVITSYFNILRQTMTVFFPQGIGQIAEALISIKRLQTFLMYEENEIYSKHSFTRNGMKSSKENGEAKSATATKVGDDKEVEMKPMTNDIHSKTTEEKLAVHLKNATAKWSENSAENSLNDLNIKVAKRSLLAVIGPVGAGKSSILQAILRELPLKSGDIKISGTISYASQEPWLFAGSVRQNILFGLPMDKERYRQVVQVCSLKTDFEQFPYGDKTIVGERGVSLSGGQRARVNLARAVYKKADIYLFDDPLSAVDTRVGKHLFEECIANYLSDKTRILVTHQLQYLGNVDHIVLLEQGSVTAEGSFQQLQETGLDFTKLLSTPKESEDGKSTAEETPEEIVKPLHTRQISVQSVASSMEDGLASDREPKPVEETVTQGSVGMYVYRAYFAAGGHWCFVFSMFFLCFFAQVLASGSDAWITYWVNLEDGHYPCKDPERAKNMTTCDKTPLFDVSREWCIYIFAAITFSMIIVTLIRSFTFVKMCMNISMNLHNAMFNGITRASMYFFNTNPSGRILNRFSKDMGSIDEMLPSALIDCVQIGFTLLGIIVVVAFVNPYLLIPTFIIAFIFYKLRQFYLATSRSVKRLEGITRSPVFSHLNASLQGLTTIRAFGAQTILEKEFDNHQDLHSSAWYLFLATSRAFGFWLDMFCVLYIALVTFSFLLILTSTSGGNVGLAITQAIGLTGMFQWGMRQSAELENQMTSVERVLEYGNVTPEANLESPPDKKPPASWPGKGEVVFEKMYLKYEPNGHFVLRNLNFTIKPEEKVGIVGRTGAGKSSLIAALFRLAENQGQIRVDGIDINTVGLHEVRSKISIIPQEPVLFSGTMRKNLDPFDEYPDHVLWNALEKVELKEAINDLTGGLNAKMSEGGSNFSVGQRQLVCLARAIVRNNKILVLDEATANVDPQTDALIQMTIREKFKNCTVLTIAHRLNTVMDSDKVLVMDAGTCVEFDHPHLLLQNREGFLSKMVENTGRGTSELLHDIARRSYKNLADSIIPHIDEDLPDVYLDMKKDL
ncbi:probable multidrug resistance-associated protein lethal(2)03659 isoform X2 [Planococcus citri]|uniref:probable multidrug resistance-associated protein lethal(2)03659 isoform X2 n=1 Tax=Planococcus citri TaxID=170843 RepID=UPI0031FA3D7D